MDASVSEPFVETAPMAQLSTMNIKDPKKQEAGRKGAAVRRQK